MQALPAFNNCLVDSEGKAIVSKTGLGSSAALTTSLVGALLAWFGVVVLPTAGTTGVIVTAEALSMVHNLAQLVHANAQGKIGSGFDVSSAVYGTHVYTRFDQAPFESCLEASVSGGLLAEKVAQSGALWNQRITAFALPPGTGILLGDICGGSNSPSMAKAVLAWKSKDVEGAASALWTQLGANNTALYEALEQLNTLAITQTVAYETVLQTLSEVSLQDFVSPVDSPHKVRNTQ